MAVALSPMTPPLAACSEHELIAAVRAGSDRAFAELFGRYHERIVAFIRRRVGDAGRAEDLGQDVFIAALRRLRETDAPVAFKAWLYEIAKNACIDEFRRYRRASEVSLDAEDGGSAVVELHSHRATPERALADKQSLSDLRAAFGGLPESQHRMLVMRELEGLSYEQIAHRLAVSQAVVESALFRARRRLSEEYEEVATGRRCQQVQPLIASGAEAMLKLGVRQRRRVALHLAHCQPCRRRARMAGADEALFTSPGKLAAKLGALLPFPALRGWRFGRRGGAPTSAVPSSTPQTLIVDRLAPVAQLVDPTGPAAGFGRFASAAAAIAVAGLGGGFISGAVAPRPQQSAGGHVLRAPDSARVGQSRTGVRASAVKSTPGPGTAGRQGSTAGQPAAVPLGSHPALSAPGARTTGPNQRPAGPQSPGGGHGGQRGGTMGGVLGGTSAPPGSTATHAAGGVVQTVDGLLGRVARALPRLSSRPLTSGVSHRSSVVAQLAGSVSTLVGGPGKRGRGPAGR